MHSRTFVVVLIFLTLTFLVFPCYAEESALTDDEKAFLTDILDTGIPMLYQIPEAMNTGVFYGTDTAIADIASKKSDELANFTKKISGYTLGADTAAVRDSWFTAGETLKTKLEEYGTLSPGCGSCVSSMNAMYPVLLESAAKANKDLISFYEKKQVSF